MRIGAEPAMRIQLARKAKVGELDVARSIQQQVFRLEISVSEHCTSVSHMHGSGRGSVTSTIGTSHMGIVAWSIATSAGHSWLCDT